MSTNNDNAMTRFLFAILQQKCLKDIDWNKVARDPILTQEITNGHAARMRYSRFKSAMLGLEPQRRNRTGPPKSKVTKTKKETKAKKEAPVKQDPQAKSFAGPRESAEAVSSEPEVKREASQAGPEYPSLLGSVTGPPLPDTQAQLRARLLTPCSDTDLLGPSPVYAASPASDMLHTEAAFDFAPVAHCGHDHGSWPQNPPYAPFGVPYELDGYAAAGFCEHQHTHHHAEGSGMPSSVMQTNMDIKNEEWDNHYHEI